MDKNLYLSRLSQDERTDFGRVDFGEQPEPQKVFSASYPDDLTELLFRYVSDHPESFRPVASRTVPEVPSPTVPDVLSSTVHSFPLHEHEDQTRESRITAPRSVATLSITRRASTPTCFADTACSSTVPRRPRSGPVRPSTST